jgi:hypothetical protein
MGDSQSSESLGLRGVAIVAAAIGAVAVGAFAIGAMAIGRLAGRWEARTARRSTANTCCYNMGVNMFTEENGSAMGSFEREVPFASEGRGTRL